MLLEGLMCPDSSGVGVSLLYLQHMEDIKDVCTFSWGSAVLAFLYRELCTASQRGKHVIGGAMQLLQIRAWSRIKTLVPKSLRSQIITGRVDGDTEFPLSPYGARWTQCYNFTRTASHSVRIIRDIFDRMTATQFIWQPYDMGSSEVIVLPPSCNTLVWRSQCPLINYAIVEMHRPEWVMQQFGLQQHVPPQPSTRDVTLHDIDRRGRAGQDWAHFYQKYVSL
ncbi:hypothetical protein Pfo_027267 [Paulownia fortunei]|nr:hypothetical protein Pfo_027267 [Paulownia fortunei]